MSFPTRDSRLWMPYTQMKTAPAPPLVRSGKGAVLELEDGRRILDCISSWWVTLHGHAQPEIARAICAQANELEQVIPAGFTHEPAEQLAHRLVEKLPPSLSRVFYSDNGSTAVEIALKMALQYWKNQGVQNRTRFLSFSGSYHGDTLGAMSVGAPSLFNEAFREVLFEVDYVPFPATFRDDADAAARESRTLQRLELLLEKKSAHYAAMILEPLVQGAAGMRLCRSTFLQRLEELLQHYGILVIYDEVMVGFGRTGEWFACGKAGTRPDLICLAKGLTGGFTPLAATVCTEQVYDAFYSDDPRKALYHGHSYCANPIGCAAALASMELLEKTQDRFRRMASWHDEKMSDLASNSHLHHLRICGTIAAMDLDVGDAPGYLHEVGPILRERFLERGFLLRPLGNVIYILPPYCIDRTQLDSIYDCIEEVVAEVSTSL